MLGRVRLEGTNTGYQDLPLLVYQIITAEFLGKYEAVVLVSL